MTTSAPSATTRSRLRAGASHGMTMIAGMPKPGGARDPLGVVAGE